MRFLVDLCVPRRVLEKLGDEGHDVVWARDGDDDEAILAFAVAEQRIVVTEDTDFGELVFRARRPHAGVVLLRAPQIGAAARAERVCAAARELGDQLARMLIVIEADGVRSRNR